MKSLKDKLLENMELTNIMDYNPKDVIPIVKYELPYKFSYITLEEFCELNGIIEEYITKDQINYFYDNYGRNFGLPACKYNANKTHNDWIIENLTSHNYEIIIKRIKKLLKNDIIDIDVNMISEKHNNARIIAVYIKKSLDIINYNDNTKLLNCEYSKKLIDILNFHNYYVSLTDFSNETYNIIYIEPKYTDNATNFVKSNKYIYHVTHVDNLENILKKGLRPKAKKTCDNTTYRYFSDRIYFISNSENIKNELLNVIKDLNFTEEHELNTDYVVLKIDISKLNITFWWDDASKGTTVYTYESIPPKFITIIDNLDIL